MSTAKPHGGLGGRSPPYDVLGVVFSFLPLADVSASMRTCRHWHRAANNEKKRTVSLQKMTPARVHRLCTSRSTLRRHVAALELVGFHTYNVHLLHKLRNLVELTSVTLHTDTIGEWILYVPHVTTLITTQRMFINHTNEIIRQLPALTDIQTRDMRIYYETAKKVWMAESHNR